MIASLLVLPALHVALIGALGGLVGAFAYLDRRIFFAESVTHGTFPGAVLGVVIAAAVGLGHSGRSTALYIGAFLGTIPLVALMRALAKIPGISSQGAAGIVLTAGFAAGYFLATWFKPLPLAVNSFLTGSVITVSPADVVWAAAILVLTTVTVSVGHSPHRLQLAGFPHRQPAARRLPGTGGTGNRRPRASERRRDDRAPLRGERLYLTSSGVDRPRPSRSSCAQTPGVRRCQWVTPSTRPLPPGLRACPP